MMTDPRTIPALLLITACALLGCVEVRQPLAESEGGAGGMGGDDEGAEGDRAGDGASDPSGEEMSGAAGVSGGHAAGGAEAEPMQPRADGTYGGSGGFGEGGAGDFPWGMAASGGATGDWGMAGAGDACGCDDGDACTIDSCHADGTCSHESVATTTDHDGDMVTDGCDCDDQDPDVHPHQTQFFGEPRRYLDPMTGAAGAGGAGGADYDYDCDGYSTPLLTSEARECELYAGLDVCFGDGWLLSPGQFIPECGVGSAYQACEFREGACTAHTLMMVQRCR